MSDPRNPRRPDQGAEEDPGEARVIGSTGTPDPQRPPQIPDLGGGPGVIDLRLGQPEFPSEVEPDLSPVQWDPVLDGGSENTEPWERGWEEPEAPRPLPSGEPDDPWVGPEDPWLPPHPHRRKGPWFGPEDPWLPPHPHRRGGPWFGPRRPPLPPDPFPSDPYVEWPPGPLPGDICPEEPRIILPAGPEQGYWKRPFDWFRERYGGSERSEPEEVEPEPLPEEGETLFSRSTIRLAMIIATDEDSMGVIRGPVMAENRSS